MEKEQESKEEAAPAVSVVVPASKSGNQTPKKQQEYRKKVQETPQSNNNSAPTEMAKNENAADSKDLQPSTPAKVTVTFNPLGKSERTIVWQADKSPVPNRSVWSVKAKSPKERAAKQAAAQAEPKESRQLERCECGVALQQNEQLRASHFAGKKHIAFMRSKGMSNAVPNAVVVEKEPAVENNNNAQVVNSNGKEEIPAKVEAIAVDAKPELKQVPNHQVVCECGATISTYPKLRELHNQGKKHMNFVNKGKGNTKNANSPLFYVCKCGSNVDSRNEDMHIAGKKHQDYLASLQLPDAPTMVSSVTGLYVCACGKKVDPKIEQQHLAGKAHRDYLDSINQPQNSQEPVDPVQISEGRKYYHTKAGVYYFCECDSKVYTHSEIAHINGKRHRAFVNFKEFTTTANSPTNNNNNNVQIQAPSTSPAPVPVQSVTEDAKVETKEEIDENDDEDIPEDEEYQEIPDAEEEELTSFICDCGKLVRNDPNALRAHAKLPHHQEWANYLLQNEEIPKLLTEPETLSAFEKISLAVNGYHSSVSLSAEDIRHRENYRKHLENIFKRFWRDAQLLTFGSSASGLCEKGSDMDFTLVISNVRNVTKIIYRACQILNGYSIKAMPIAKARVPILKSTQSDFNRNPYNFDICVNRMLGVHNSNLLKAYTEMDPRVQPLALVLKKWSKCSGVYNPSGGLSSYALSLLLISFLQTRSEPVVPNLQEGADNNKKMDGPHNCYFAKPANWNSKNTESIGSLLFNFFVYYWQFDFKNNAISVRLGKVIPKAACGFKRSPICIEDPFEIDFNCARLVKALTLQTLQFKLRLACTDLFDSQDIELLFEEGTKKKKKKKPKKKFN